MSLASGVLSQYEFETSSPYGKGDPQGPRATWHEDALHPSCWLTLNYTMPPMRSNRLDWDQERFRRTSAWKRIFAFTIYTMKASQHHFQLGPPAHMDGPNIIIIFHKIIHTQIPTHDEQPEKKRITKKLVHYRPGPARLINDIE